MRLQIVFKISYFGTSCVIYVIHELAKQKTYDFQKCFFFRIKILCELISHVCVQHLPSLLVIDSEVTNLNNTDSTFLNGDYEDYTWGYRQNPLDYPLPREFQLHLVPLIPHSVIAKAILVGSLIFIFLPVWKIKL